MHNSGHEQRSSDAETLRDGEKSGAAVVVEVLARVQNVEAANPQSDRRAENQGARIEAAGDGDPCGGGRNTQRETKKKMRPGGEAFGEGVEEKNGQGERCKFECQKIQLPRGEKENGDRDQREGPRERHGKQSGGERALPGARIFAIVA